VTDTERFAWRAAKVNADGGPETRLLHAVRGRRRESEDGARRPTTGAVSLPAGRRRNASDR